MKTLLAYTFILVFSNSIFAAQNSIGEVQLDANGRPFLLSFEEATSHCTSKGGRLPTIREFAEFAQANGALGIRKSAYQGMPIETVIKNGEMKKMESEGFRIYKRPEANSVSATNVDFYFNPTGYTAPSGAIGDISDPWKMGWPFWSSSVEWSWYDLHVFWGASGGTSRRTRVDSPWNRSVAAVTCVL